MFPRLNSAGFRSPNSIKRANHLIKGFVRDWLSFVWAAMRGTERFAGFLIGRSSNLHGRSPF